MEEVVSGTLRETQTTFMREEKLCDRGIICELSVLWNTRLVVPPEPCDALRTARYWHIGSSALTWTCIYHVVKCMWSSDEFGRLNLSLVSWNHHETQLITLSVIISTVYFSVIVSKIFPVVWTWWGPVSLSRLHNPKQWLLFWSILSEVNEAAPLLLFHEGVSLSVWRN